jgi:hypothetical protein
MSSTPGKEETFYGTADSNVNVAQAAQLLASHLR